MPRNAKWFDVLRRGKGCDATLATDDELKDDSAAEDELKDDSAVEDKLKDDSAAGRYWLGPHSAVDSAAQRYCLGPHSALATMRPEQAGQPVVGDPSFSPCLEALLPLADSRPRSFPWRRTSRMLFGIVAFLRACD